MLCRKASIPGYLSPFPESKNFSPSMDIWGSAYCMNGCFNVFSELALDFFALRLVLPV